MAANLTGNFGDKDDGPKHQDEDLDDVEDNTAFGGENDEQIDDDIGTANVNGKARLDYTTNDVDSDVVNFHMDDLYLRQKWRREMMRSLGKWFAKTLAILLASTAFCILGGYMFSAMELFNEIETCKSNRQKYQQGIDKAKTAIGTIADNFQLSQWERVTQYLTTLDTFIGGFKNSSWKGEDCETMLPDWNFMSATFFCLTVVTSIGYGYIAPVTFWGRCVLIAYAVIGIPMYLAALANIGSFFAEVTHYAYHQICCCGSCRQHRGDVEARQQMRTQMIAIWRTEPNAPSSHFLEALDDDSGGNSSEEEAADEEVSTEIVPLSTSLLILVSAIVFGGSIFWMTENWNIVDAIYFAFVTMATVGFGDLVPGLVNTKTGKQTTLKFIILWGYIVFGMAILSTCLQMSQDNVEGTVKSIMKFFSSSKKNPQQAGDKKLNDDSSEDSEASSSEYSTDNEKPNEAEKQMMKMMTQQHIPENMLFGPGDWGPMPGEGMPPPPFMMMNGMMRPPPSALLHLPDRMMNVPPPPPQPQMVNGAGLPPPGFIPAPPPQMMLQPAAGSRLSSAYQAPSIAMRQAPSAFGDNRPQMMVMMQPPPPGASIEMRNIPDQGLFRPPPSAISNRGGNFIEEEEEEEEEEDDDKDLSEAIPAQTMFRPPPSAVSNRGGYDERLMSANPSQGMFRPPPSAVSVRAGFDTAEDNDDEPAQAMARPPPSAISTRSGNNERVTSARPPSKPPQSARSNRGVFDDENDDDNDERETSVPTPPPAAPKTKDKNNRITSAYEAPAEPPRAASGMFRAPPSAVSVRGHDDDGNNGTDGNRLSSGYKNYFQDHPGS